MVRFELYRFTVSDTILRIIAHSDKVACWFYLNCCPALRAASSTSQNLDLIETLLLSLRRSVHSHPYICLLFLADHQVIVVGLRASSSHVSLKLFTTL